jgi:predicted dehydrogenase
MKRRATRRQFLSAGGGVAAWWASGSAKARAADANQRIALGFLGVGNRGSQLLKSFLKNKDIQVAALCDVDRGILENARKLVGEPVACEKDFRSVLAMRELDAVVIATPDHWHAVQTIMACEAGKDAYVEKPLSITVVEGRKMVEAARRTKRIVQVGLQRRSSESYRRMVELAGSGGLGKVTVARAYRLSNMSPAGIGKAAPSDPPPELDWDMWLGPRPMRPYVPTIHPYKFRWWNLYSSQAANWGVHYFDAIRWVLGATAPRSVAALGGKFAVDDDRTVPDTLEVVHELPSGCLVIFGQYEANMNSAMKSGEIELRGTQGTAYVTERGFQVAPERGGQFQDEKERMKSVTFTASDGDTTDSHVRNFVNCLWNRQQPNADVEEGHRSTVFALLANISLEARARLEWDAEKEAIISPPDANRLLHYEYRAPWKLP